MENKPPVEKGGKYTVDIYDIGINGEGIGKIDGFTVFVKNALPKERVLAEINDIKKSYCIGDCVEIIKKSPYRIKPICPYFENCGGCTLQHVEYSCQLEYKTKYVKDVLERIGGLKGIKVENTIGMETPVHYRNKMQFPLTMCGNKATLGFYAEKSSNVVPLESCLLADEKNKVITDKILEYINEFQIPVYERKTGNGIIRHVITRISKTGEIMVIIVAKDSNLPRRERFIYYILSLDGVKSIILNLNKEKTSMVMGRKNIVLYGRNYITDTIADIKFHISPESFFQVNPLQTELLYKKILEFADLTGKENVLDIYCGIGTISLFLAKKANRVWGVEIVEKAIEDAEKNAVLNNIKNCSFTAGAAEKIIPKMYETGYSADVVIVDPPRKGCDKAVVETVIRMQPKKIIYVSCEPSTLARDLKDFTESGYEVKSVQPFDQFCFSMNIETVVRLDRKNN